MKKIIRRRKHDPRATRAGALMAQALVERPVFIESEDGYNARVWKKDELQAYSNEDIAKAISGKRAFEHNELLGDIQPSAIKYACTKGWLWKGPCSLYYVTQRAATDLRLPRKGAMGTIKFLERIPA